LKCNGILDARYRLDGNFPTGTGEDGIWEFAEFFPPIHEHNIVSLGEGWTPYVEASNYAKKIGIRNVWCKLEGCNPTGSFKDRVASLGLSLTREWTKKGVFTASSGNAAAAISAYAARAHVKCLVLIRDDSSALKISQVLMYSPLLLRVKGLYESRSSLEAALTQTQQVLPDWLNHFLWAPFNPLLVDAFKTISYEIALSKKVPDYVFVPTAGGDLLFGLYKGFNELTKMGKLEVTPKLIAVQGEGADPTVQAIEKGLDAVRETGPAKTVAGALRVNFGADHSIVAVKATGGFGISVSDERILSAQKEIAREEGIFCEISSAAAIAAISKAVEIGRISRDETVAAILTGVGFKDYHTPMADISQIPLAENVSSLPALLGTVLRD
jgi:threonine synthase